MQQMMGMFQMFMMNQTIGINAQQQATLSPNVSPSTKPQALPLHNTENINNGTLPSQLKQSQSAININPPSISVPSGEASTNSRSRQYAHDDEKDSHHHHHSKASKRSQRQRTVSDSDYDSEHPFSDNEEGLYAKSKSHRKKNKHRKDKDGKKERKKDRKKDKKKHKRQKDKNSNPERQKSPQNHHQKKDDFATESVPTFDEKDMDINVPPPPSDTITDAPDLKYVDYPIYLRFCE